MIFGVIANHVYQKHVNNIINNKTYPKIHRAGGFHTSGFFRTSQ